MVVLRFVLAWAGLVALLVLLRPVAPEPSPWLEAAHTLRTGGVSLVPPLWPSLALLGAFLGNTQVAEAGLWVTMVAAAGVPVLAMELARRVSMSRAAGLVIGLTAGAAVAPFAFDLAPNALFAFILLVAVAAGLEWEARADEVGRTLVWLCWAALAALTHEAGLLVLWTVAIACAARSFPRAALETAVATTGVGLFMVVAGRVPQLPPRLADPLVASPLSAGAGPAPVWAEGGAAVAWTNGDRLAVLAAFFERFVTLPHAAGWVVLVGAVGAAVAWAYARNRRYGDPSRPQPWALLSALSPALAALFVWTRPEDLLVVVPVGAIGVGALVIALGEWKERLMVPAHALLVAALLATAAPLWWAPPSSAVATAHTAAEEP